MVEEAWWQGYKAAGPLCPVHSQEAMMNVGAYAFSHPPFYSFWTLAHTMVVPPTFMVVFLAQLNLCCNVLTDIPRVEHLGDSKSSQVGHKPKNI